MIPWVITREADDAAPLVAKLAERGFDARCIPAIERRPLAWPPELDPNIAGSIWFLTSAYAARRTLAELAKKAATQRFAALSPATAAVLHEAKLDVAITATGGSVGLAKALVDEGITGEVLYPTSDVGVLDSPEQMEALGILSTVGNVRRHAVYLTAPAPLTVSLDRFHKTPYAAVFFSPSAVNAYADAVRDGAPAPDFAVCVGGSTQRAAASTSFAKSSVLVPHGADVVEFICSLQEKSPT